MTCLYRKQKQYFIRRILVMTKNREDYHASAVVNRTTLSNLEVQNEYFLSLEERVITQ